MQLRKPELTAFRTDGKSLSPGFRILKLKLTRMTSITERLEGGCGPSGGSRDGPCERQTGLAEPLWPAPRRPARTQQATVILHPRPKELILCLVGPRQTRTPTARPPGPGAGSIRPQAVNKEKAPGQPPRAAQDSRSIRKYPQPSGGCAPGPGSTSVPRRGPAPAPARTPKAHRVAEPVGAPQALPRAPGQRGWGRSEGPGS